MSYTWVGIVAGGFVLVVGMVMCVLRLPVVGVKAYARRVELPVGSSAVRAALERRTRTQGRIAGASLAASGALILGLVSVLPGSGQRLLVGLGLLLIVLSGAIATVSVSLRDVLMTPAPGAARIARSRRLDARDYLGPVRRALWPSLLVAGVAGTMVHAAAVVAAGESFDLARTLGIGAAILAVLGAVAVPVLDRAILARPRPASHSLELAWDDVLCTEALGAVRAPVALLGWLAFAASFGAQTARDLVGAALAGQLVLFVYGPQRLRPRLRPAWVVAADTGDGSRPR